MKMNKDEQLLIHSRIEVNYNAIQKIFDILAQFGSRIETLEQLNGRVGDLEKIAKQDHYIFVDEGGEPIEEDER
jgi:hypothetical protein